MPLIRHGRPAIRPLTLGLKAPALGLAPALAPMALSNKNFFQKFIRTYIERVRDQAQAGKARDKFDRLLQL